MFLFSHFVVLFPNASTVVGEIQLRPDFIALNRTGLV